MTRRSETIDATYFETLYRSKPDPWAFRTSTYERAKYAATLAAIDRPRVEHALEVGCSIGVFTASLAARCNRLLAVDGSATALDTARQNCAGLPHVRFEQRMIPASFPPGRFDLIVLSEVLYYLTRPDLVAAADRCFAAQQAPGDTIILCHWLGETDYPLTGDEAATVFVEAAGASGYDHTMLHAEVYRLDRLTRR